MRRREGGGVSYPLSLSHPFRTLYILYGTVMSGKIKGEGPRERQEEVAFTELDCRPDIKDREGEGGVFVVKKYEGLNISPS